MSKYFSISVIPQSKVSAFEKLLTFFLSLFICTAALCSFFPRDWNWGIDILAFFPLSIRALWLILSIIFVLPFTRHRAFLLFKKIFQFCIINLGKTSLLFLFCLLISLFWFFPVQSFLLGDGANHLRSLQAMKVEEGEEIDLSFAAFDPTDFSNEPYAGVVNWAVFNTLRTYETGDAHLIFRITSLLAFIIFIASLWYFFSNFNAEEEEKFLMGGILFLNAASLFFFGYVEYYAIFYALMLAFILSGWLVLQQRLNIIVSGLVFGLMLGFHFASIVFAPCFLVLLFLAYPNQKK